MLGEARLALGRIDGAIEAYEMAAEINPRNYAVLGDLYEKQGRWADAARSYEQALANPRAVTRELRMRYFTALLNSADKANAAKARDGLRDYLVTNPAGRAGAVAAVARAARARRLRQRRRNRAPPPRVRPDQRARRPTPSPTRSRARREYRKVVDLLTPFVQDLDGRSKGYESDAALLLSLLGARPPRAEGVRPRGLGADDRGQARSAERACAQLARLHAGRARRAPARSGRLHRAGVEGRSRQPVVSRQPGLGAATSRARPTRPSRTCAAPPTRCRRSR